MYVMYLKSTLQLMQKLKLCSNLVEIQVMKIGARDTENKAI